MTPANPGCTPARRRSFVRGFTLVELLIVVAMIGVLAALAMVGYRRYLHSAGTSEATALLQSIRASQESYKSESLSYLSVNGAATLATLYPRASSALDDGKAAWGGGDATLQANWQLLNVSPDGPVKFGYACVADLPGTDPPGSPGFGAPDPAWSNAYGGGESPEPWFVAIAVGNRDGDSQFATLQISSFSNEVIVNDDTE